jgi:hypothetical protein
MLTDQQKAACREYMVDFTWCAAMQRAGYTEGTAKRNGWKLFKNPAIAHYLKQLMDKAQERVGLSADFVLEELRRLAASNIADYYKLDERKKKYVIKPLGELTREQTAAIHRIEPDGSYILYNKDPALDKLAKYFKLYSEVESVVTNFVMMPEVRLRGKPLEFNIGKPAPKRPQPAKKN